jgi:lipopolysaccharide biosynthesis glycosyltransferase
MSAKTTISLVSVCDNHFISLLAALAKSIDVNHRSDELIHYYIVDDNISLRNKQRLERSLANPLLKIIWVSMSDVLAQMNGSLPNDNSSFPLSVYMRLILPFFLPEDVKKVIYLDVDMLVLEDVAKLWHTDIANKIVAGVVDRSQVVSSSWGGIKNYKELGLLEDTKYFNTGLMLINLDEWKREKITERVFKCIKENQKWLNFPDQYGLNVVFANQWHELDRRWNCVPMANEENPFLIHFIGRKPIFKGYNYNEKYKQFFFSYLKLTEWKDFKQKSEFDRLAKKLFNKGVKKLKSILPARD